MDIPTRNNGLIRIQMNRIHRRLSSTLSFQISLTRLTKNYREW